MTNKVKPFYIRITDDMTPQMVQDAFDKCVDAGAYAGDCIEQTTKRNDGWYYHGSLFDWKMFGVCEKDGTYLTDDESSFSGNPQEITLDQLDEWLGLEVEQEWDGEGLPPVGAECEFLDINGEEIIGNGTVYHVDGNKFFVLSKSLKDYPEESTINMFDGATNLYVMWVSDSDDRFRKPETLEQKAERERLAAVEEIADFLNGLSPHCKEKMEYVARAIVDKTNYRKQ